jgi:hypothetical protein
VDLNRNIAFVVTTIGTGDFLKCYIDCILNENVSSNISIIVIPDLKTPAKLFETCEQIKKQGIDAVCPTVEAQNSYLAKLGEISSVIPCNSDNRRNVGFLMALEKGCDTMISVDDDNYLPANSPFFGEHLVVGRKIKAESVSSNDGWFNICDLLDIDPIITYPRGFPYSNRHKSRKITTSSQEAMVHINAGLWLGHPDIDAVSCLYSPARSKAFKGKSVLLGNDTWSPINTQNTAISRQAIPAYYFWRMGYPLIGGMPIDRDGDIFSGFCIQACARHLGYCIRVGSPITDHRRNSHNYMKDLAYELACIWILEDFTQWLHDLKLQGGNYVETYLCLAEMIDKQVERFSGFIWNDATRGYFHYITHCMRTWIDAVKAVGCW